MAKVWGPIHSDDARGKLANATVFIGWRGLKTVRQYKKPANPRTENQVAWRGVFTDSVAKYHTLNTFDVAAWVEYARGMAQSGFNSFVQMFLEAKSKNLTPVVISVSSITPRSDQCQIVINTDESCKILLKYGTKKGTYTGSVVSLEEDTQFTLTLADLSPATKYYFTIQVIEPSTKTGFYGIGTFETAA
jgi:hypothetical protein